MKATDVVKSIYYLIVKMMNGNGEKPASTKRKAAKQKRGATQKKSKPVSAAKAANAATVLMRNAAKQSMSNAGPRPVTKKQGTRPRDPQGWVHRCWEIVEAGQSDVITIAKGSKITDENFGPVSAMEPRLRCIGCKKKEMAWEPSTYRQWHLFKSGLRLSHDAAKDAQFLSEKLKKYDKKNKGKQVCTITHLGRSESHSIVGASNMARSYMVACWLQGRMGNSSDPELAKFSAQKQSSCSELIVRAMLHGNIAPYFLQNSEFRAFQVANSDGRYTPINRNTFFAAVVHATCSTYTSWNCSTIVRVSKVS